MQLCGLVPRLSCSILVLCLYDNSKLERIVIRAPDKTSTRESGDEAMSAVNVCFHAVQLVLY